MKPHHIFPLLISLLFLGSNALTAQEEAPVETVEDSIVYKEQYGLRIGIEITRPVRTFFEDDFKGFELLGDYRIYEDYYLAAEIGNAQKLMNEPNVVANYKGSYIKVGANYNAYNNWQGMQNSIFVGLRYGFSTFSSELLEYSIYTQDNYFEPDIRTDPKEYNNLTASWLELQLGVKVEILNNLYLGAHVALKRRITQTTPLNFDNLYIPGFNRTYDGSTYGTGYGYSISYLIPFYKM